MALNKKQKKKKGPLVWRNRPRATERKTTKLLAREDHRRVKTHVVHEREFSDGTVELQISISREKDELFQITGFVCVLVGAGLWRSNTFSVYKPITLIYLVFMWVLSAYLMRRKESEVVKVIPHFGVQIGEKRFFEIESIENVIINETVTASTAFYYMALLLKNKTVIPLFTPVNPVPAHALTDVFKTVRGRLGMQTELHSEREQK